MSDPPPPYPGAPGAAYPLPEKCGIQPSAPGAVYYPQAPPYPTAPAGDLQAPPPQPMMHPPEYGQPPPPGSQAWIQPPPPPHGYGPVPTPPHMLQHSTTLVIQPHTQIIHFGESSVRTHCPKCNADIMTSTHYETGNLSWVICLLLSFFGCIFGCCLIPFCMDTTKDIVHTCPNCCNFIGRYSRL